MNFDDFEQLSVADLRRVGNSKWTTYPDAIGTFIAESDFGTAPEILDLLHDQVERAAFGYSTKQDKSNTAESFARWAADRFDWNIDPRCVGILPEVLTSLEITLTHFTRPGSAIVVPTPTYMPFFTLLRDHGREIIETPMRQGDDGWTLDYAAIEAAFAAGAGLLVLVNPANPTGTVFDREQLLPLVDIVDRYGGRVWADEIHAPIIYDGRRHVPYASLSDVAAAHTVTATSASKGWNIPGLKCSQTVFTNPDDLRTWEHVGRWPSHATGHLGILASTVAYTRGRAWLEEFVKHIAGQRDLLGELVAEHLPRSRYVPPQGTYLAWLDLRDYGVLGSLQSFLLREAGVAGTDGVRCGRDFRGFFRINFATPAAILEEKISRISRALHR